MIQLPSLSQYFEIAIRAKTSYQYCTLRLRDTPGSLEEAAQVLAWYIMILRCAGASHHFYAWVDALNGGYLAAHSKEALSAFVAPGFGVPGQPKPADHLDAAVAEYMWFVLHLETASLRGIALHHAEVPKIHVTAPGGDGLVFEHGNSGLEFRLWELKKHTSSSHISRTVRKAYEQLNANALVYLAEYTALGVGIRDPALRDLYGRLVDVWLAGDRSAGAGVGVATSDASLPLRGFSTFPTHFPRFTSPARLDGVLAAAGQFHEFASMVRDLVWTGL